MQDISEIQRKAESINKEMMLIYEQLRQNKNDPEMTNALAEQLAKLLFEAKIVQCSLKYFHETAERLNNSECSGPH